VLKWILCSLRTQFYVGNNKATGLKKLLNAFVGELFIAHWTDSTAATKIITEQVRYVMSISVFAVIFLYRNLIRTSTIPQFQRAICGMRSMEIE